MKWNATFGNSYIAQQYIDSGLAITPIDGVNGTKSTEGIWKWSKHFEKNRCPQFFGNLSNPRGIAIICGKRSMNLELLDFDNHSGIPECKHFDTWYWIMPKPMQEVIDTLPLIQTPSYGRHLAFRCETIGRNIKLAERPSKDNPKVFETWIETRGEGGLFVAPGSPPATHKSKREYELIQGNLLDIPVITLEQRKILFEGAKLFDMEREEEEDIEETSQFTEGPICVRPINKTWEEILEPHGWTRHSGNLWTRPHKYGANSASVGGPNDTLYVFSSNASPFEMGKAYTKTTANLLLNGTNTNDDIYTFDPYCLSET